MTTATTAARATGSPKVALVIGAGDSTGGAIAKRFSKEGYIACMTRRNADKLQPLIDGIRADGEQAFGYASDARKEEEVTALFEAIEAEHGPIDVMVFNIGANVPCSILDETARKLGARVFRSAHCNSRDNNLRSKICSRSFGWKTERIPGPAGNGNLTRQRF